MTAGNVVVGPDWTPPEPSKIPWPPKGGERGCRPGLVVISELVETRLGINFTFQELLFRPVRSSFFSQAARDVRGDRDRVLTLRAAVGLIPENRPSPLLVSPPLFPQTELPRPPAPSHIGLVEDVSMQSWARQNVLACPCRVKIVSPGTPAPYRVGS